MDHVPSVFDALIGSRHFSNASTYLSPEEAALDIALIAHDAGWTPAELEQVLLNLENSQNNSTALEKFNTLVGVAGLALSIYTQFFAAPPPPAGPPQAQQEHVTQAFAKSVDTSPYIETFRQPTDEEMATYFARYEMRKTGDLLRRPAPSKKGPYFESRIRDK